MQILLSKYLELPGKQGQPETIPAPGELRKEIMQSGIWYILSKNSK